MPTCTRAAGIVGRYGTSGQACRLRHSSDLDMAIS